MLQINKIKTLMTTTNLMSRSVNRVNGFTMQDLVIDLVELSEEDLKQISGGGDTITATGGTTKVDKNGNLTNTGGTVVITRSSFALVRDNNYLSVSDFDSGLLLQSFPA